MNIPFKSCLIGLLAGIFTLACQPQSIDEPPEEPLPLLEPEYVLSEIQLMGENEGFDLDGDGTPNNALALLFSDPVVGPALGGDPNEYIAKSIRKAKLLLLLDFKNFNSFINFI